MTQNVQYRKMVVVIKFCPDMLLHFATVVHMADHAGGRRSVVNPGTKLWRSPVEVTQLWRPRSGFGARFRLCKTKQK